MKKNIAIVMGIAFALFVGGFAFGYMQNATTPEVNETEEYSYEDEMVEETIEGLNELEENIDNMNNALDEFANSDDTIHRVRAEYPDMTDEEIEELVVFYAMCYGA